MGVRRDRRRFPVGARPTRQPLQPEATGAVMEVTKWLKPSECGSRTGDRASVQAATRVNAEQASKRTMCGPTRQPFRGRLIRLGETSEEDAQTKGAETDMFDLQLPRHTSTLPRTPAVPTGRTGQRWIPPHSFRPRVIPPMPVGVPRAAAALRTRPCQKPPHRRVGPGPATSRCRHAPLGQHPCQPLS
jgi:hypothetical protein